MTPPASAPSLPPAPREQFEGPLDLLLNEVRRQSVAIEKIVMAPIVARFLEYVQTAAERNLNLDIEWLHMAATLIHWKSQSLLPQDESGETEPDPIRDGLVQQLLAHRKQAAAELDRRRCVEEAGFSRPAGGEFHAEAGTDEPEESPFVSVWDLMQKARELAGWVEQHRRDRKEWSETFRVDQDDVTVAEMIVYLRNRIPADGAVVNGTSLLQDQATVSRRLCLFLGMLEMARDQRLQMAQNHSFGPIALTLVRS